MIITEIKQPITIKGRRYQRYIGEDGLPYLTACRFPFPIGTELSLTTDDSFGTQEPPTESRGTPRAVGDYLAYCKNRIVQEVDPVNLTGDTQVQYALYKQLCSFLSPKSAIYFLQTYSPQALQEYLLSDPYWFYTKKHGLEEENFSRINKRTTVSTFFTRKSQMQSAVLSLLLANERKGNTWMTFDGLHQALCWRMESDGHLPPGRELTEAILLSDQNFS